VRFQTSTQLVVEVVGVKDKNGNLIEGLTAKDFAVTENGTPQAIALCEFQKLDDLAAVWPVPASPTSPATETTSVPAVAQNQIASERPGDLRYRDRRLLVLYFDRRSMRPSDQYRAYAAALGFIRSRMAPVDLLAIMVYLAHGELRVLEDFTADRDRLSQTIQKLTVADEGLDDASGAAFGQDDDEFNVFTTDRQLSALQTAVSMLGHLNEKKSMVYFASGATFGNVGNLAQMRALSNAAIRANVSIFTVDARGLVAEAPMGDASQASPGGIGMYTGASAIALTNGFERSQDALHALAADTGGKALFNSNDLAAGIVQAQKANSSHYIIGYYTTTTALDGKFRRIVVSLKEYASAKLDYRQGYFGGKEFGRFTTADKERQLEDALMLDDPITDLTIAMELNYFQLSRAEYYVPVVMKIPGSELARARKGGAEHTVIDFIGEIKDEGGRTVQNIRDKVDIKLNGATAAELSRRPIEYDTGYTLLPGEYSIKVLARDDETGRIGTYITKFVIPNLNKEEKRVPLSSVVLSGQRVNLRNALYTVGKDKEQVANPLVQEGRKLIPSVTRVFSRSDDLFVYLQAYQQSAATPGPLVAFVTFFRGGARVFETPPVEFADVLNNRLKTTPLKFSIALGKLLPGQYYCQVTVLDWAGQKATFWQAPILVVP
jgi:VWFA-related protein